LVQRYKKTINSSINAVYFIPFQIRFFPVHLLSCYISRVKIVPLQPILEDIITSNSMRIRSIFYVVTVLLLTGCGNNQAGEQIEAQKYELLTVKQQDYTIVNSYPASIKGRQDIKIIPRVDGYLESIHVREGDKVRKGQILFTLDAVQYRAAVEQARANVEQMSALLAKALQNFDNKKSLLDKKVVSDATFTDAKNDLAVAKANLAAAKASLAAAQNNLSFTVLRSPSDGVIGKIPYRKGDYVGTNTQDGLTVVADNQKMYVYFSMTERRVMEYMAKYQSMDEAIKHMPALNLQMASGQTYAQKGYVESVSGVVDESTGAVSVRAVFDNANGLLLSGGTGQIMLPAVKTKAIVIPQEATYEVLNKVYVMKVIDGKTVATIVGVDNQHNGKEYVVTSGLKPGDVIIAKGASYVKEGQEI
jgi:membrane fusion protein (multidrug efflux system)